MRLRGAAGLPRKATAARGYGRTRRAGTFVRLLRTRKRIIALGPTSTTEWTSYSKTMVIVVEGRLRPGSRGEPHTVRGRHDGTVHLLELGSGVIGGLHRGKSNASTGRQRNVPSAVGICRGLGGGASQSGR